MYPCTARTRDDGDDDDDSKLLPRQKGRTGLGSSGLNKVTNSIPVAKAEPRSFSVSPVHEHNNWKLNNTHR